MYNKTIQKTEQLLQEIKEKDGKISFPIDPFRILREKNIFITFSNFDKLEGLLLYDKNDKSIVSINLNRPVTRQRFTAAHELGHIILHTKINGTNFLCPKFGAKNSIEREADDFASYLLMPNDELNRLVNKYQDKKGNVGLDECLFIAEYFGVSFESCVKTIRFRLNRLAYKVNNIELNKIIRKYKPKNKRKELFRDTDDLNLLMNLINYSHFSIPNVNEIVGIKFIENLIYHDNRLENVNLTIEEVNGIFADLRVNGIKSKYCKMENQNIIEALGNIEMNKYCLETEDEINILKIRDLHRLLYKYAPFPEASGVFKSNDNLILGGKKQPISTFDLLNKLEEINDLVNNLITNINEFSISSYINEVANIHYKLTILHPFADGNGRIARAFMNWLLRLKGLCPIYINFENKDEYLNALAEIDDGNSNQKLKKIIIKSIINTMSELHQSWK